MRMFSRRWRVVIAPLVVCLSATTLALAAAGVSAPALRAVAYDCGFGNFNDQKDAWNGSGHGWLGACYGAVNAMYYSGEDWGGTVLSGQTIHLRAWSCGYQYYNQTYTTYNTSRIGLSTTWTDYCALQADSNSHEWINGQFDWSWYLNY